MGNLFIIGNGFDISHGLHTKYEHFQKYLNVVESRLFNNQESKRILKFLIDIIDDAEVFDEYIDDYRWTDFETSLNYLDFTTYLESFDMYDEIYGNRDRYDIEEDFKTLDSNIDYHGLLACTTQEAEYLDYRIDYRNNTDVKEFVESALNQQTQIESINEQKALQIAQDCSYLNNYFSKWVNSIEINKNIKRKKDFYNLINSDNSIFLTFNYTKTLELLYKVNSDKICHIHGIQGGNIVFGHGQEESEVDYRTYVGSEYILESVYESYKKDTSKIIMENEEFFDSLSGQVDNIYSYGFSFSEVDLPYIRRICESIETENVVWYINDYDEGKCYRSIIKGCGFKGKFSKFRVEK